MPVKKKVASKAAKATKKSSKKTAKKKAVDPQLKLKRKQRASVRSIFKRLGFTRVKSDNIEFTFDARTGEIDDVFVWHNVLIVAEYTVTGDPGAHVAKKSILYNKIKDAPASWTTFASSIYPGLKEHFQSAGYKSTEYRVFVCYFSTQVVSDEIANGLPAVSFLDGTKLRYFESLTRAIHGSARHEFFKFLDLPFGDVGPAIKTASKVSKEFAGHVLPESFSSFPSGFKITSFYADPETLLSMSYVLRRDSWRDPEGMYQRVLNSSRMNQMRKYLTTEERVFVNNIIVTLPSQTVLNDPSKAGKNLDPKALEKVRDVTVLVPFQSNSIGLVDGQHRVFCYHEGKDKYEPKIGPLRSRQNLLVTGIIFPEDYSEQEQRRFEAKLFLEINDKQKRTGSELKQSIELILNPYSALAISKAVVHRLNLSGGLKGMLQTNFFDPTNLIKTTSIVSYGLRPLLKLEGSDSLFSIWKDPEKDRLRELQRSPPESTTIEPILKRYIDFAVLSINNLMIAAKKSDSPSRWKLPERPKDRELSPTIINGLIVCLRFLVENGKVGTIAQYEKKLSGLEKFQFKKYKSSNWRALGSDLYQTYFS